MNVGYKGFIFIAVTSLAAAVGVAHAQVDAGVPDPDAQVVEPVVEPVAAPEAVAEAVAEAEATPAEVSGLVEPRDPPDGGGRKTARVMLVPVRGLWWLIWSPIRGFAWAYDRYAIQNRVRRIFFSEDGRIGLFPTAAYKSGFGVSAGARLVVRDVLSEGSRLQLTATYRGEVLQAYWLRHRTGRLFGPDVQLETAIGYETFPRSRFFGIGNGDQVPAGTHMNVDSLRDDTAVGTVFYYDAFSAELAVGADLPGPFRLRLAGGYRQRDFSDDVDVDADAPDDVDSLDDDDFAISSIYDTARIVGFQENLSNVYGEASLTLTTLRQADRALSEVVPSSGWFVRGRLGLVGGLSDDPSEYWRWGIDVQRYIDLYRGDRVLLLRATLDGVTGSLSDVPFIDLPRLGGPLLLRGYQQDRFRDRQAGVATVEYQWGIDRNASAFVFTDVGRVWRNYDDFATGDPRVAFGGGLEVHSMKNFIGRVMLASSLDGGLYLSFRFDPLFDTRGRP